jgi:hypothetical protein
VRGEGTENVFRADQGADFPGATVTEVVASVTSVSPEVVKKITRLKVLLEVPGFRAVPVALHPPGTCTQPTKVTSLRSDTSLGTEFGTEVGAPVPVPVVDVVVVVVVVVPLCAAVVVEEDAALGLLLQADNTRAPPARRRAALTTRRDMFSSISFRVAPFRSLQTVGVEC